MATYLWHSAEAEITAQALASRPPVSHDFGRLANRNKLGFCIYLDEDGDPVRVTCDSDSDKPPTYHKDIRLVGVSENATCLVSNTGFFDDDAKEWCTARDITPSLGGLLSYMGSPTACMRMHTKKPLTVGKPLKLKTVL